MRFKLTTKGLVIGGVAAVVVLVGVFCVAYFGVL